MRGILPSIRSWVRRASQQDWLGRQPKSSTDLRHSPRLCILYLRHLRCSLRVLHQILRWFDSIRQALAIPPRALDACRKLLCQNLDIRFIDHGRVIARNYLNVYSFLGPIVPPQGRIESIAREISTGSEQSYSTGISMEYIVSTSSKI